MAAGHKTRSPVRRTTLNLNSERACPPKRCVWEKAEPNQVARPFGEAKEERDESWKNVGKGIL